MGDEIMIIAIRIFLVLFLVSFSCTLYLFKQADRPGDDFGIGFAAMFAASLSTLFFIVLLVLSFFYFLTVSA